MEADPLFSVKQAFYGGSYKECIAQATSSDITDPSSPESISRAIYAARSNLALNPPSIPTAESLLSPFLSSSEPPASIRAVSAFCSYLSGSEEKEEKIEELRDLILEYESEEVDEATREEERIVRVIAGSVFMLEGEVEEALATLSEGCGKTDMECTALLIQLLLSIDRRDLAQTTYQAAKKWGDDSLLIQVIEAWIGMKTGARPLQQSYYLYEELYQLPTGRTPQISASHAAAHYLMGHIDEAKADLIEAGKREDSRLDPDVLAVGASLGVAGSYDQLASIAPEHPLVQDTLAKSAAFDEAAAKFSVAV